MKAFFCLVRSALIGSILAVCAVAQPQARPMRPVPVSPPGSNQSRVPWTELQTLKMENIGLRQQAVMAPMMAEREALLKSMCADAHFQPGSCLFDPQGRTVTGTPIPPRTDSPEPSPKVKAKAKKKKKHEDTP